MKKTLLTTFLSVALALGAWACGDGPLAGAVINGDDVTEGGNSDGNNDSLDATGSYLLTNAGATRVNLGLASNTVVSLKLKTKGGTPVPNAKITLDLQMQIPGSASLSTQSDKIHAVVTTDSKGLATAYLYSSTVEDSGILHATVKGANGQAIDCNDLNIKVSIRKSTSPEGGDGGGGGNDTPSIVDDDPPNPDKATVTVSVMNNSKATKAEINIKTISSTDTTDYCAKVLSGEGLSTLPTSTKVASFNYMGTAAAIFRDVDSNQRAVVYAYGLDSGENEIGNAACQVTDVLVAKQDTQVSLTLAPPPEKMPDLNQTYDTLLHLNLTTTLPPSWQKWFGIIDGFFVSPVGTAIYYTLYAWEYRKGYENGGGSKINLMVKNINAWETIIRGSATKDPTLPEVLANCEINGSDSTLKTGTCPEFSLLIFGPFKVFKLAVEAAEDALNGISGFGDVYDSIKTIGSDISRMIQKFDIGARFELKNSGDKVSVTETWTHAVWTWRYGDECDRSDVTCGRHAVSFLENGKLDSSFVHDPYDMDIQGLTNGVVTLNTPEEHTFLLRYGKLIRMLINNVVVPKVLANGSGYDTDGQPVNMNGPMNLGTLLKYVVPCQKITEKVYDWVIEKTSNWEVAGFNVGALISSFLSASQLEGYCDQGLDAGADLAMNELDKLVADANIKVRPDGSFKLKDVENEIPKTLVDLKYLVGYTVLQDEKDYDATITGEGILAEPNSTQPSISQCAQFLVLSDTAAMEACGN